jgi:hypothetical protein
MMSKPKRSSTRPVKGVMLARPPSSVPCMSPETLEHMRSCEAREWIARYKKKIGEVGSAPAQSWWEKVKSDIRRIRGEDALQDLINRMNKERANVKSGAK